MFISALALESTPLAPGNLQALPAAAPRPALGPCLRQPVSYAQSEHSFFTTRCLLLTFGPLHAYNIFVLLDT